MKQDTVPERTPDVIEQFYSQKAPIIFGGKRITRALAEELGVDTEHKDESTGS
jgi:methanogenic corrinoid protein MtbC1